MALFDESSYAFSLSDGRLCQAFTRRSHLSSFVATSGSIEEDTIPLFVNEVWPGCKALSNFIDIHSAEFTGKAVIEFGAGCALPSCVAAMVGASSVVITDYPGEHVLETIELVRSKNQLSRPQVNVLGHEWGQDVSPLLSCNDSNIRFDVVLVAEPFWRDTKQYHAHLLQSINAVLADQGNCYIAFCHRPCEGHTAADDLHFFVMAQDSFSVEKREVISNTYHDVDEYAAFVDVQLYVLSRK